MTRVAAAGVAAVLTVALAQGPASATIPAPGPGGTAVNPDPSPAPGLEPGAGLTPSGPPIAPVGATGIDAAKLRATMDATHEAGMYGLFSAVRDGDLRWNGASGAADVRTGRPMRTGMRQRVGSITKTFVATAILQQVEKGRVQLDGPIGRYLPDLFPGQRGQQITVRMLLNHTSGIGDYVLYAFPSLSDPSSRSLDRYRFRDLPPEQMVKWGLQAPPTGDPGERWSYSNTNYVVAGLLLEKVTGTKAQTYIAKNVIRKAGLKHTYFPSSPHIDGAHPRMYESLYQHINPPRDYSTYNMSWAWTAGALVSTMDDLNRFYRTLLTGGLLERASLAEMEHTVPAKDADGNVLMNYGLGIYSLDLPCGTFWGHDGSVFGAGTQSLSSSDGKQQISLGFNLMKYQRLTADGTPIPHPIDSALYAHVAQALCGARAASPSPSGEPSTHSQPLPLQFFRAGP
ncbi:serine hydrolase domain-containing protein [Actinomadura rubrisoli]|uniref:serine hydrolase domain-containing protein n=1 Tax=Actinomadura rubrisoli TaxID=2530368 RepID=UPI001FB6A299|nr:serine hydrolase domain-containing protein [Actinomadura rubrisoli]